MKTNKSMGMTPKFRIVLEQAIESGVKRGYSRAFKYIEAPSENTIIESIEEQVMSSLYDWFDFDDEVTE